MNPNKNLIIQMKISAIFKAVFSGYQISRICTKYPPAKVPTKQNTPVTKLNTPKYNPEFLRKAPLIKKHHVKYLQDQISDF